MAGATPIDSPVHSLAGFVKGWQRFPRKSLKMLPLASEVMEEYEVSVSLDDVYGAGTFVEIEVVLEEKEALSDGEKAVRTLLVALRIPESSLVEQAYIDLLAPA